MSFTLWATAFTNSVSTVSAEFLNKVRVDLSRALDGVNGGTYTLASLLTLMGSGLKLGETTGAASNVQLASRTLTRVVDMADAQGINDGVGDFTLVTGPPEWIWKNPTVGGRLLIPIRPLHGAVLDTVTVRWKGAAGHGALPTMPTIRVYKKDKDGVETALAAATSDTAANVAAYEVVHSITTGALAHTVDRSLYSYHVKVTGETGGNFVANAQAQGAEFTEVVTSYNEHP